MLITLIFFLLLSDKNPSAADQDQDQDCSEFNYICRGNNNCRDCIRAHHCCVWCYDESFEGQRCDIANSTDLSKCDPTFIERNTQTKYEIKSNKNFTDVESDTIKAVQLSPGEFNIDLRYGEPINISIQYRPAKNYHLDLYYLMDLTYTMKSDLDTLKNLGSKLADELSNLTKNHRIAFGSYIDKPDMPFYQTDPQNIDNPCFTGQRVCEKGYLFKHKLNFTKDTTKFTAKVGQSDVSANTDNLEGGFDALMQIMMCGRKLGWLDDSRKLVIIATEGEMHFAGDGLLAGYTKRNLDKCLVDDDGNYTSIVHYDYPSLEEIHHQLKTKKMNVIIAAKDVVFDYYEKMAEILEENIFVGKLERDSTNVLTLVEEGYYAFMKRVNLYMNTSRVNGLKVDFFADCDNNGNWVKKATCNNAEEGKPMNFKVQFLLNQYQTEDSEQLDIEEQNIYDKIKVKLNFVGSKCKCSQASGMTIQCMNGENICGDCVCNDGWTGIKCEEMCQNNITLCRFIDEGTLSLTCSGRGNCECSKCRCDAPYVKGEFCQYICPYDRVSQLVCGGHGDCIKGICKCHTDYINDACTCHNVTENCRAPGSNRTCSSNGFCRCNKCICETGYSGQYCERCQGCSNLCQIYEPNVIDHVLHKAANIGNETVRVMMVETLEENEENCVYRYDSSQGKKCDILYRYKINENRTVDVEATPPTCNEPIQAGFVVGLILAAFLAVAALIIVIWKGRNMYLDRAEYQRFERDRQNAFHSEQNPIYKNPVVSYQNPMGTVQIHSKSD